MKVYLVLNNDEIIHPETILLVGRQSDAEKLVNDGYGTYYEVIEVLSSRDVEELYKFFEGRG